jgi:hypothetical protein
VFRVLRTSVQGVRVRTGTLSAARTLKCLLLRLDGLDAAGTARWRDYRHISAWRGRLPDLPVNMYWRANHPAGAREFVAQISFPSWRCVSIEDCLLNLKGRRAHFVIMKTASPQPRGYRLC